MRVRVALRSSWSCLLLGTHPPTPGASYNLALGSELLPPCVPILTRLALLHPFFYQGRFLGAATEVPVLMPGSCIRVPRFEAQLRSTDARDEGQEAVAPVLVPLPLKWETGRVPAWLHPGPLGTRV